MATAMARSREDSDGKEIEQLANNMLAQLMHIEMPDGVADEDEEHEKKALRPSTESERRRWPWPPPSRTA